MATVSRLLKSLSTQLSGQRAAQVGASHGVRSSGLMMERLVSTERVVVGVTDHNVYLGRLILARQVDNRILIFYTANVYKESRR